VRVLHVIPSVSPVRGGPSQAVLEAVGPLRRLGIDAEIATTNDDGPGLLDVPLDRLTDWNGVPVRFFPRFSPRVGAVREFAFSAGLTRWLWRHVRDYDLLHVHALFSYPASMAMRVARARAVPFLCRPSGLLCRWSLQQSRAKKRLFLRLLDRANLNASAAIEYTAEQEREESGDVGLRAPAVVLPYGLHLAPELPGARAQLCQRLGLPEAPPIVLFMSRLHVKKGLNILVDALGQLAATPFSLVVAGSGSPEYEQEVKTQVAAGPLRDRTHFVGFAGGDFKQLLLQGADLFVLPSHSESFAISVLEAIASGTPVLTTPGVPLASLVERFDLGWVAEPDVPAMTVVLRQALPTAASSTPDRARGRRLVEKNFSWESIAARLSHLYRAVLDRAPLPSFELAKVEA
jgi:glycosyltransferase involved in cell wall biosynthesis